MSTTFAHFSEKKSTLSEILPKNWSATDASTNYFLDVYLLGIEHGEKAQYEKMKGDFMLNFKVVSSIAEELFSTAKDQNIPVEEIHLRLETLKSFDVLFLVEENFYNSQEFASIYQISRSMKKKYKSDRLDINFSFISNSEELSKSCLAADGYFVKYGSKTKA